MERKALWMLRMVCTLCLILFGTMAIIGSTESKDDDDGDNEKESASLNGVWEMKSETGYDTDTGACETTPYGDDFSTYLKFNNSKMSTYWSYDGTVYTCSGDDKTIDITGNDFTDEEDKGWTFDISGDTLTVTAKQADNGCYEKIVFTKASESDIENAVTSCENDEDEVDDDEVEDDDDEGDTAPLNGVWEINSETGYDDYSDTCETQAYGYILVSYLEFNNNKMSTYGGYGGTVYTCPDNDKTIVFTGNSFKDEDNGEWTFEISGDTLTVTAKEIDHGCYEKTILTKASESDIENAIYSCENE